MSNKSARAQRSFVIHTYICIYTRRFILSVCSENTRVAPRVEAPATFSRLFVPSFLSFSSSTMLVKPRNTPYRVVLALHGHAIPQMSLSRCSTIVALSQVQTKPMSTNKGISGNGRNTSEDEERQRSNYNNVRYCSTSFQKHV